MVPPLQAYCENSPVNTLYTHIQASLVAQTIKNLPAMQETQDLISGLERSPGKGNGNLLQYSCLENSMD